jgi:aminotransferase
MFLLETIGLAGVPGEAFFPGADGRQFIRFSYAKIDSDIDDACRRIARLG